MVPVIGILIFVLLFAAFPLVTREGTPDRSCGMCGVKRRLGLCDGSGCPSSKRGPGEDSSGSGSATGVHPGQ